VFTITAALPPGNFAVAQRGATFVALRKFGVVNKLPQMKAAYETHTRHAEIDGENVLLAMTYNIGCQNPFTNS